MASGKTALVSHLYLSEHAVNELKSSAEEAAAGENSETVENKRMSTRLSGKQDTTSTTVLGFYF